MGNKEKLMQKNSKSAAPRERSPALRFIDVSVEAMPRSTGDRVYVEALDRMLSIAIECRFRFDKDDGSALKGYGLRRCVGVFDPLNESFYRLACIHGGTFAAMWERAHATTPWIATLAAAGSYRNSPVSILTNNRIAPGIAVVIPSSKADDDSTLARAPEGEVWWCTSMSSAEVVLCRYRYTANSRYPYLQEGAPAKRRKLSRSDWEALWSKAVNAPESQSADVVPA